MKETTFYDNTPFEYGYSSKDEIISNMNPLLKQLMESNKGKIFCDIGCGCGRNLVYASKFAKDPKQAMLILKRMTELAIQEIPEKINTMISTSNNDINLTI